MSNEEYGFRPGYMTALDDVERHLHAWCDALEVNLKRAECDGHPKQAERLRDAISHYEAVRDRILVPLLDRINPTAGEGVRDEHDDR